MATYPITQDITNADLIALSGVNGLEEGTQYYDTTNNIRYLATSTSTYRDIWEHIPVNVKDYGAIGNGIIDDTVSIQTALNTNLSIYFPVGTYIVSNIIITNDGTHIFGDGMTSIISMKSGATGNMVDAGSNTVYIEGLSFIGGYTTSQKTITSSTINRSGIVIMGMINSQIHNISISGFGNTGLVMIASPFYLRTNTLVFSDSTIYNNWIGIDASTPGAEYSRLSDINIHHNYWGIKIGSGNFTISNSKINDNGYGVHLIGGGGNDGHGNINGGLITHNTTAIFADGITYGFDFIANTVMDGDIYLKNSIGIKIESGIIDVTNYYFEGGGRNYIRNNFSPNGYGNSVHHNYNLSTDYTVMVDNILNNGLFIDNSFALISNNGVVIIGDVSGNANAILDIKSTTKAFMPPRMTNTQMVGIPSPTESMIVYDLTNHKLCCYDGSVWQNCW